MKLFFYATSSGKEPVRESLNKLPIDERAFVYARLSDIEEYGFDAARVVFKQISGKLWEIKFKFKNQHRVLYCFKSPNTLILLHYIKKKTQKLEKKDKQIGEKRMLEVFTHEK